MAIWRRYCVELRGGKLSVGRLNRTQRSRDTRKKEILVDLEFMFSSDGSCWRRSAGGWWIKMLLGSIFTRHSNNNNDDVNLLTDLSYFTPTWWNKKTNTKKKIWFANYFSFWLGVWSSSTGQPVNRLICRALRSTYGNTHTHTHTHTHTLSPAPWGGGPCGRTSGFRRWRWGRCRGRGRTGRVWGSTAAGEAAAAPTRRWRCWQSETSAGSPSPGRYWRHTHTHTHTHKWRVTGQRTIVSHNAALDFLIRVFAHFPAFSKTKYPEFEVKR